MGRLRGRCGQRGERDRRGGEDGASCTQIPGVVTGVSGEVTGVISSGVSSRARHGDWRSSGLSKPGTGIGDLECREPGTGIGDLFSLVVGHRYSLSPLERDKYSSSRGDGGIPRPPAGGARWADCDVRQQVSDGSRFVRDPVACRPSRLTCPRRPCGPRTGQNLERPPLASP